MIALNVKIGIVMLIGVQKKEKKEGILMKEYRIVTQHGNAKPYSLWSFKTYEACFLKLMEIIQSKKSSISNEYYVLNDFFENQYLPFGNITKYRIEVREITDWRILTEKEKENRNNKNNKIINIAQM